MFSTHTNGKSQVCQLVVSQRKHNSACLSSEEGTLLAEVTERFIVFRFRHGWIQEPK